jgi:excisionase family DNA binding protein
MSRTGGRSPSAGPWSEHSTEVVAVSHSLRPNQEVLVNKLLLTVREAAEMLSISRAKLYELLGGGVIESVKLEGSRRIPREALDEYIERLRRAS